MAAYRFGGYALTGGCAQPYSAHTTPLREEFLITVHMATYRFGGYALTGGCAQPYSATQFTGSPGELLKGWAFQFSAMNKALAP